MAVLYRVSGFQEEVFPSQGGTFSLAEMQTLVGGYIEYVPTTHADCILVVDEEGKLRKKPVNVVASTFYLHTDHDRIVGDAVLASHKEVGYKD